MKNCRKLSSLIFKIKMFSILFCSCMTPTFFIVRIKFFFNKLNHQILVLKRQVFSKAWLLKSTNYKKYFELVVKIILKTLKFFKRKKKFFNSKLDKKLNIIKYIIHLS